MRSSSQAARRLRRLHIDPRAVEARPGVGVVMARAAGAAKSLLSGTYEPRDGHVGTAKRLWSWPLEPCVQAVSECFKLGLDAHSSCVIASRPGDAIAALLGREKPVALTE
jgi:hypothetical protein